MYKIKATAVLKQVMGDYFSRLDHAPKIAWCTSVGPAELLRSFGFEVYFPENHGALLGAGRTAMDFIPSAVNKGYSGHVCSYTTADIGSFLQQKTPLIDHYGMKGIPKPDLIVYNTNQCREVEDWFHFYARHFNCPIAGIKPPRHIDHITEADIAYVSQLFQSIIPVCEESSGKKYDEAAFKQTIKWSREATLLWQKVLRSATQQPSPISFFDGTIHMGPIVVLRGTPEAKAYYTLLWDELQEAMANQQGHLDKEEIRLFWDGMPIWGKIRMFSDLFQQNNTVVVASTYCSSWIFDQLDENDPWGTYAKAYTEIFINRSESVKAEMLENWMQEYKVDGIIYHDSKTCFNNSNTRFGLPRIIQEKNNIPHVIMEGDLCDLRFFSEGQSITKLEAFIEQLKEKKKRANAQKSFAPTSER